MYKYFNNFSLGPVWKYKDYYKGQKCYIIGDGPSIKSFDLNAFSDAPSIVSNMLPMHNQFQDLNVLACTLATRGYFAPRFLRYRDYLRNERHISYAYRNIVENNKKMHFVFSASEALFIKGENVSFTGAKLNFSSPSLRDLRWFNGGFYASLSLALYFGFDDIILIGFDAWTLAGGLNGHWYEAGQNQTINTANALQERYDLLKDYADIRAISNGHESGKCVTLIEYREYTGKEPMFKENYENLSAENYRILSTNPSFIM